MSLIVTIKVVPSSGRQKWALDKSGVIKCYLKSPAEKGKANEELIKFLASTLKIPQAMITIISGATARTKKIKIASAISESQLLEKLALHKGLQHALF
jgi:uncharacterized protein (TIGR00251 family)